MADQDGRGPASADPFAAFLDAIEAGLDLPADERADVREELAAHLLDDRAALMAEGRSATEASAAAIRRLGSADALARDLAAARRDRGALLAAVGGGAWAAGGAAIRGFVLGVAILAVTQFALMLALAIATRLVPGLQVNAGDRGWIMVSWAIAGSFAAWTGGRSLVAVVARRSHRRAERIRPWIAVIGGPLVAWFALAWIDGPQNVASVVALIGIPVVFCIAVLSGTDRPLARSLAARRASLALLAAVAILVPMLIAVASSPVMTGVSAVGSGPYRSFVALQEAQGLGPAGRLLEEPPALGDTDRTIDHGVVTLRIADASAVGAGWRDLRLEAWRSGLATPFLDPAHDAPFATGPMALDPSGALTGSVRVDRTRDVSGYWLVVTGVARDGIRNVITDIGGGQTTFTGTALDWLTAP
jgi:hypothetical protein